MVLKATPLKQSSKQSLPKVQFKKVTVQKSIVELWTVISNQIIKYLTTTSYAFRSSYYGKLTPKLLAQVVNKILSSWLWKVDGYFFFIVWYGISSKYGSEVIIQKYSKQTLL